MYETHRKTVKLLVNWYYRPEDPLTGGRQVGVLLNGIGYEVRTNRSTLLQ